MNSQPAIYILTNKPNGTLYTGVTSNLQQRIWQHKNKNKKTKPAYSPSLRQNRMERF